MRIRGATACVLSLVAGALFCAGAARAATGSVSGGGAPGFSGVSGFPEAPGLSGDTVFHSTPAISEAPSAGSDTLPVGADSAAHTRGFINKIIAYFAGSNEDRTYTRKIDFSVLPGPHYSSDVGFGLGVVASGQFRIDRTDSLTPVSNVSLVGDIATSGFWKLGLEGSTIFRNADFRIDYDISFNTTPEDKFWGVGYRAGRDDDNETKFRRAETTMELDFMRRIAGELYGGVALDFRHFRGKDFHNPDILAGQKHKYTNFGAGLFLLYDSRDSRTAPYRGWFVKLENIFYPGFLGNDPHFNKTMIITDFYHPAWDGAVLAYDLYGEYNDGQTPWTALARMGGMNRMRGYYEGRYRDRGLLQAQVELRQKVWRRIGATVWAGAGNVFSSPKNFDIGHTLPNYGFGVRWEFKNRVNVRLDFGFGKGESGIIFNINEAF